MTQLYRRWHVPRVVAALTLLAAWLLLDGTGTRANAAPFRFGICETTPDPVDTDGNGVPDDYNCTRNVWTICTPKVATTFPCTGPANGGPEIVDIRIQGSLPETNHYVYWVNGQDTSESHDCSQLGDTNPPSRIIGLGAIMTNADGLFNLQNVTLPPNGPGGVSEHPTHWSYGLNYVCVTTTPLGDPASNPHVATNTSYTIYPA